MNFNLTQIPARTQKPRSYGLTMVMDKGMSVYEARNFCSVAAPHVDLVKLGFGTSFVTPNLKEKIAVYKEHGIPVYFGGPCLKLLLSVTSLKIIFNFCRSTKSII